MVTPDTALLALIAVAVWLILISLEAARRHTARRWETRGGQPRPDRDPLDRLQG